MVSTVSNKCTLLLFFLLSPNLAIAGDWKFTSGIALSEYYSDNANLAASGAEQAEWITEISPRFSVRRDGARLKANADYSLQGLLYLDGANSNKLRHSLNGSANAELLEDWFYFDGLARLSHELNSLAGGVGTGGGPAGIGNTTSVGAYSLSPYLKHRFGAYATVEARVALDGVFIGNSGVTDTATTRYALNATSGTHLYPLSWGVNYSRSENNNSNQALAQDSNSEQAAVNARYQLSREFSFLAQAGMEKNNFTGATAAVRDYSYYGLGVGYTPSRRFSMDVLYNTSDNGDFLSGNVTMSPTLRTNITANASQRAYGRSYGLGLSHRTRFSNWSLRYQDELTTSQQQFQNYLGNLNEYLCSGVIEYQLPGNPPSDPANCTYIRTIGVVSQTQLNQTYLSKNLIGNVSYSLRRNTWTLSIFNNQREFQTLLGGNDTVRGLQAAWSLRPEVHTTFTLSGGMSQTEESVSGRSDDLWNIGLVATRQFQPKLSGSMEVRHQERESNLAGGDYTENSVAARVNMTF
jgi:uncharacterized protein (PEP-CTERM system associated)